MGWQNTDFNTRDYFHKNTLRSICNSSQQIIETFLEFGLCAPFDFKSINQSRYDRSGDLALIQQFNKGIAVFV